MTYEEKISWLSRYREAEKLYQRLSYRLAEAQEATRHITQNLSAAPGGSKDGQSLARAVEREEEAERRAYAQLAVLDALFAEIDAVLVQLDSAEYCALLVSSVYPTFYFVVTIPVFANRIFYTYGIIIVGNMATIETFHHIIAETGVT